MLTQSEVRFLPTHRIISAEDCELLLLLKEGGLSVRQITRVLELEKNVKHGYFPFLEKDIHNLFIKVRNKDAENDAMALLKHCEDVKKDDAKFKYSYTMDNEGKLQHIFWSPSPCFDWYTKYCDVVVFDTTYKVNAYEMPFGVFVDTIEEFEHKWPEVIAMYNLESNKHVKGLYHVKEYWALPYLRDHFFGGMTTTERSESINIFIKRFINSQTSLSTFFKQVDLATEDIQRKEEHDTMLVKYRGSSLKPISPLQEQAHGVLTEFAFEKFQEEFERSIQYSIVQENDCCEIPHQYLPSRWRRQASCEQNVEFQEHNEETITFNCSNALDPNTFVQCPPISKTKGRPKRKRCKGGIELAKRQNTCGLCNGVGHNIATYSRKESIDLPTQTQKLKKKKAKDLGLNPILNLKA
ncbi:Protein FAR1-RELATED SEQUENCE 11 [Senna tora]|uniref:Protein FAR1-RELATED SEQUENCE n=1 Tax=Senna tora TaxID=362788 RepID=A0A834SS19_9FABA|nr:Protein FAR1-RELATED SEQUENCE 11 [Senna tora]